ncbi:MAG: AAA family ATPase [Akkermansiaceae bacterium]|nr:AAA family ATPase [Verrucomicrobiales bacterium]
MASVLLKNPFVVGGALGDSSGRGFVGREDIFDFVRSSLMVERRIPILLHGQRRIGKSSILKQLPRNLPADFVCVYFDLQGKATMEVGQVLYGLGREIADALGIERPEREDCSEELFPRYLDRAIKHLGGRAERLVLLFDEFDVVDQSLTGPEVAASRFIPYLAKLVNSHSGIGYILVVGRKTEEMSSEFFGTILKDTVGKAIGRLNKKQTLRLIKDLAPELEFDPDASERVYELAAGHPFCTQMLCHVIWNRNLEKSGEARLRTRVRVSQVDKALPTALDLGSNGMNWIYDGLSKPSYRLVLSALAEVADPLQGEAATLDEIDKALRKRRMAVDQTDLAKAPRVLIAWDILLKREQRFAFTVPMIGAWIRENRPLETLENQTVIANPRAHRYYELALESLNQNNYDGAVEDFRNALAANPVFIEALLGLSSALRLRKKPGDLHYAVEAYERILDLEPSSPSGPLIELLAESIDAGGDVATIRLRYKRLQELDPDGPFLHRAARILGQAAAQNATYESKDNLTVAETLFEALGDKKSSARVTSQLRRRKLSQITIGVLGAIFGLIAVNPSSYLSGYLGYGSEVRGATAALTGALLGLFFVFDKDGNLGWRRTAGLLPLALIGGAIGYFFKIESDGAIYGIGFAGLLAEAAIASATEPPAVVSEITAKRTAVDDPQRKLLEGMFASWQSDNEKQNDPGKKTL